MRLNGLNSACASPLKSTSCKCSGEFLKNIKIPSLIISAVDDPFLPKESYPYEEAHASEYVHLLTPRYGGHVGFVDHGDDDHSYTPGAFGCQESVIVSQGHDPGRERG